MSRNLKPSPLAGPACQSEAAGRESRVRGTMRKILAVVCILLMCVSLPSCRKKKGGAAAPPATTGGGVNPPPADKGFLKISSFPSGAKIYIDGKDQGVVTPAQIQVAEGTHTIKLVLEAFKEEWQSPDPVNIVEGVVTEITPDQIKFQPILDGGPPTDPTLRL